jgi:hypothetical protein
MDSENPGCCVWLISLKKSCNERVSGIKELKHSVKMFKLEFFVNKLGRRNYKIFQGN